MSMLRNPSGGNPPGVEKSARMDSCHQDHIRGSGTSGAEGSTLLTVRDVAHYLAVHEKTVYDWVARGQLPCIRLGNRLRFDPHDLTRWLRHRREGE